MSSALLSALLVLQVFTVYGASRVQNGVVGESVLLPTEEKGPIKGDGFMQWKKNSSNIIKLVGKNSNFESRDINPGFEGRLIMNSETGSLNISRLREEDSGEYDFSGLVSSRSLQTKVILQVFERISSVQVTSQVNNSTDSGSCNVTLSCIVIGRGQMTLFWTRNGGNITGAEYKTVLTVLPTLAEESYACTASNPISSQSHTITVRSCHEISSSSVYIYIAAGAGALLVVMMVIALVCVLRKSKRGKEQEDLTVYAEVADNMQTQKNSKYSQRPDPADLSTCYDVIKNPENPAPASTVYELVNFQRLPAQQYQEVL